MLAQDARAPPHPTGFKKVRFLTVIVILALVALFIGLRLYSVLGERTGHEQQPILKPADPEVADRAARRARRRAARDRDRSRRPCLSADRRARASARLLAADPAFDVARFLEGAQAAYRLILESFWKGDLEAMRPHVDDACLRNLRRPRSTSARRTGWCSTTAWSTIDEAVIAGAEVDRKRRAGHGALRGRHRRGHPQRRRAKWSPAR